MPSFIHDGATVHYGDGGTGNAVLLLHAGGSSGAQWRRTGEALGSAWRLLTPDFYGHGGSDGWSGAEALQHDDQADLAAAVLRHADAGPVHIVGHSYGGSVAVRMVLRGLAEVRSLVLIEPMLALLLREVGEEEVFLEYETLAHGFLAQVEAGRAEDAWRFFIDYRNGAGTWDGFPQKTRDRFLALTDSTRRAFTSNLANPTTLDDCRALDLPVTVVCGERTTAPDRRVTELLRDAIPGARYEVIAGAEHMSPLTHPAEVAAIVAAHLADA